MDLGATFYVKNTLEAVDFYIDAFGMTLGYNAKHEDGTYLHAELQKGDRTIFAVSENDDTGIAQSMLTARQPTMSCGVNLDNEEQLKGFVLGARKKMNAVAVITELDEIVELNIRRIRKLRIVTKYGRLF